MITPCICGARFRSTSAEARHRHNFPAYCLLPRRRGPKPKGPDGGYTPRKSRAKSHIADAGKKVGEHV